MKKMRPINQVARTKYFAFLWFQYNGYRMFIITSKNLSIAMKIIIMYITNLIVVTCNIKMYISTFFEMTGLVKIRTSRTRKQTADTVSTKLKLVRYNSWIFPPPFLWRCLYRYKPQLCIKMMSISNTINITKINVSVCE